MPSPPENPEPTDVVLPMYEVYMDQVVSGIRTHDFRKYLYKPSVKRVWFYVPAPASRIKYICEIGPATTREFLLNPMGAGNREFNERLYNRDGYDYAYELKSLYELRMPISLWVFKHKYGYKNAPKGLTYLSDEIIKDVAWNEQKKIR